MGVSDGACKLAVTRLELFVWCNAPSPEFLSPPQHPRALSCNTPSPSTANMKPIISASGKIAQLRFVFDFYFPPSGP